MAGWFSASHLSKIQPHKTLSQHGQLLFMDGWVVIVIVERNNVQLRLSDLPQTDFAVGVSHDFFVSLALLSILAQPGFRRSH